MKISAAALALLVSVPIIYLPMGAAAQPAPASPPPPAAAPSGPPGTTPVHHHRRRRARHHANPAATTSAASPSAAPVSAAPEVGGTVTSPSPTHAAAPAPRPIAAPVPTTPEPPRAPTAGLRAGLTPFGAIQAGNADGTIPPWTGGDTTPPARFVRGGGHPDPFAGEKKLFSITAQNMTAYAPRLTPGIQAMLREYPGYRLDVYPTHRTAAAPQAIYDAAIQNASHAHLAADGNSVIGAHSTIPFPEPKSGLEAIWNHLLRWRGYQAHFTSYAATPTTGGDYTLIKNDTKLLFSYANGGSSDTGVLAYFIIKTLAPPLYSGQIVVAVDHVDPAKHARDAWVYSPGESRVRRAPETNFDTPQAQADSLVTDDDLDLFNGSPERYTWQLVGRREIYVPYNDYDFGSISHDYTELLKPLYINPDLMRWELHRVWVVEATLKPGSHHIYPHRTFYLDEDSWETVLADQYDRRGQIWRVSSGAPIEFYEVPVLTNGANIFYDLQARRYHVRGMRNRDSSLDFFGPKMRPSEFSPEALREEGVR
jgi:hypothetical protein